MTFDVLAREKGYTRHLLCEASAGTGKTFTIEHLFLKSLLLPNMSLDKILVMTFTRSVARELALRLKRALNQALDSLQTGKSMPDYLQEVVEQGLEREVKIKFETARDDLDRANIGTIHSFCFRALSDANEREGKWADWSIIREHLEGFFRSALSKTAFMRIELEQLLKESQHDVPKLLEKVQSTLWEEEKAPCRAIDELFCQLQAVPKLGFEGTELENLAHSFKGLHSKDGELKSPLRETFASFCRIFSADFAAKDMEGLIKYPFTPSTLFAEPKARSGAVHSPLLDRARALEPLLKEVGSLDSIMARLVRLARGYVSKRLHEQGILCQEELLEQMERALADVRFVQALQSKFKCVIVDEFQDTDPRQWRIMGKLFLTADWNGSLLFVGDPKQAIYHFRKADVYSYMQAKSLPDLSIVTLTTNYRSSPKLVSLLNLLFADKAIFDLPKLRTSFAAPQVSAHAKVADLASDKRGAIHFFVASGHLGRKRSWPTDELEEGMFYPFISSEIKELMAQGVASNSIAILVKDRHQAAALSEHLKNNSIPVALYRQKSIIGQPAFLFLQRLIKALMAPRDRSRLVDLLSHEPFSLPVETLRLLQETTPIALSFWAEQVAFLLECKKRFEEAGLATLLKAPLPAASRAFWRDLEASIDLALSCAENRESLAALDEYLFRLTLLPEQEQESCSQRFDPHEEAVQILTLHASKGLEFDVVFALGLASRNPVEATDPLDELEAEKMRLFYVGCTRARQRLYLPVAIDNDAKEPVYGSRAPMELFLARGTLDSLMERAGGAITKSILEKPARSTPLKSTPFELYTPTKLEPLLLSKHKLALVSYTSLKESSQLEQKEIVNDQLPAGISSGILVHRLFYELFSRRAPPQMLSEWVRKALYASPFEGREVEVELLLSNTLRMPLGSFSLMDINWRATFCEQEFYFQNGPSSLMRGAIDLVFEHEGKCYLVDWKSNLLERYDDESLYKTMREQSYDLQAGCYAEAMRRHLHGSKLTFGGFFFIFVRGPAFLFLSPEALKNDRK